MLKVYGRANSINVRKVLWMLGELGLEYDREDWGRGFRPTDSPEYLQGARPQRNALRRSSAPGSRWSPHL